MIGECYTVLLNTAHDHKSLGAFYHYSNDETAYVFSAIRPVVVLDGTLCLYDVAYIWRLHVHSRHRGVPINHLEFPTYAEAKMWLEYNGFLKDK